MITYLGNISIGGCIPGVPAALAVSLNNLEAQIAALLAFTPGQVNFAAQLALAEQILASVQASISLVPPSIALQISLIAGLLAALRAQLQIILTLKDLMATAGVDAYSYDGRVDALGTELQAEIGLGLPSGGNGATHCNAVVLITSLGATWGAMQQVFLT